MTTVGAIWREGAEALRRSGVDSAGSEARYLLAHVLGVDQVHLQLNWKSELTPEQEVNFWALVKERQRGLPFAYIVGRKEFYGRVFAVDARVLVPRPETERLVDCVLELTRVGELRKIISEHWIVDLCTGSGAVGLTLAAELPKARICLTDLDTGALEVARLNAQRLGLKERVLFAQGDLFEALAECPEAVPTALITVNPPYVAEDEYETLPAEVRAEPAHALLGGEDGLAVIRRIISQAPDFMVSGAWLCMELGAGQHHAVRDLLEERGAFDPVRFSRDLSGTVRVAAARRK